LSNPEYIKVDDVLYKINTDFRVALECNNISRDESIDNYERALAIIYKLFGEEGFKCKNQNKMLELSLKYLSLGYAEKSLKNENNDKFELDFNKCKGVIRSSFKFDYKYDPYELEYLHWYDFYNDLENLSTSEMGNCCILNRVITILNQDASKIKNSKDRQSLVEAQNMLKEKYCRIEKKQMTSKQEESAKAFYKQLGIEW